MGIVLIRVTIYCVKCCQEWRGIKRRGTKALMWIELIRQARGNSDNKEEMKESGDEVHGRSFLLLRNRLDKGQQNMGSLAKGTRSSTRGDLQSTERGKR